MSIYLVQHGKNLDKSVDPEKGLSPDGESDARRIADVATVYGVRVRTIHHSGKKRARQTADIFAAALAPVHGVHEVNGIGPMDDVAPLARELTPLEERMIVGHLPFMERLASCLVTGNPDRPIFRFQNGGIVCLDHYPDTTDWVIKWALMPHIG
ncbi:MAG: phosphohistidine phosphatase SixA [Desulfococcaceae bacterium]